MKWLMADLMSWCEELVLAHPWSVCGHELWFGFMDIQIKVEDWFLSITQGKEHDNATTWPMILLPMIALPEFDPTMYTKPNAYYEVWSETSSKN